MAVHEQGSGVTSPRLEAVASGLFRWTAFSPGHKVELTSHAVIVAGRIYCFDPIRLAASELERLSRLGRPTAIILTNENHERDAVAWRDRWQVPILAGIDANLSIAMVDRFPNGDQEWEGWDIRPLTGGGGGELAFRRADRSLVVFGDAVVNLRERGLELLPEKYCQDRRRMEAALRELTARPFDQAVVAHGDPILKGASEQLAGLLHGWGPAGRLALPG